MKRIILASVGGLAVAAAAFPASAAPLITFDLLEARWENATGGLNVDFSPTAPNFGDPAEVTWGTGGSGDSGYVFDARDTPFSEAPGITFDLGNFTHNNFPIPAGSAITGVDLRLRGNITVQNSDGDTAAFTDQQFVFNFNHNETPNGPDLCANGAPNGVGANVNGCADIVTIAGLPGNSTFLVDDVELTLDIEGFQLNGEEVSQFETAENLANTAVLLASFVENVEETDVPEPATLALLGTGLLGAGIASRRRRAA